MYVKISIQMCCLKRYKSVLKSNYEKVYDICVVKNYFYTLIISLDNQWWFHRVTSKELGLWR
jgi:hypothetical protein